MSDLKFHEVRPGTRIAYLETGPEGASDGPCGLFWLSGFMSDMAGTKAEMLAHHAERAGRPCFRFDYSGHGASDGLVREGTISAWLAEAATMFAQLAPGPRVVIGSSMGGWLALLLAGHLAREAPAAAERIRGLVLIAPAVDMTRDLLWESYGHDIRAQIMEQGFHAAPSDYGSEPYIITRELIEDGEAHLLLDRPIATDCPVRILQGDDDPDVPWRHALKLHETLAGDDVTFTLVKGGDHRLSSERDLALLEQTCQALCEQADAELKQP